MLVDLTVTIRCQPSDICSQPIRKCVINFITQIACGFTYATKFHLSSELSCALLTLGSLR